jgi:hypothetical protein
MRTTFGLDVGRAVSSVSRPRSGLPTRRRVAAITLVPLLLLVIPGVAQGQASVGVGLSAHWGSSGPGLLTWTPAHHVHAAGLAGGYGHGGPDLFLWSGKSSRPHVLVAGWPCVQTPYPVWYGHRPVHCPPGLAIAHGWHRSAYHHRPGRHRFVRPGLGWSFSIVIGNRGAPYWTAWAHYPYVYAPYAYVVPPPILVTPRPVWIVHRPPRQAPPPRATPGMGTGGWVTNPVYKEDPGAPTRVATPRTGLEAAGVARSPVAPATSQEQGTVSPAPRETVRSGSAVSGTARTPVARTGLAADQRDERDNRPTQAAPQTADRGVERTSGPAASTPRAAAQSRAPAMRPAGSGTDGSPTGASRTSGQASDPQQRPTVGNAPERGGTTAGTAAGARPPTSERPAASTPPSRGPTAPSASRPASPPPAPPVTTTPNRGSPTQADRAPVTRGAPGTNPASRGPAAGSVAPRVR